MKSIIEFFKTRTPLYLNAIVTVIIVAVVSYFVSATGTKVKRPAVNTVVPATVNCSDMKILRNNNFTYTHPILLVDLPEESKSLMPLKSQIATLIEERKQQGSITSASVFMKEFSLGGWIGINTETPYNPGSLVKMAMMITYMKDSESNPGLLEKKLYFDPKYFKVVPRQTFEENSIKPGQWYTVKELLMRMIIYSDNYSTGLINMNANLNTFNKLYSDLNQPVPDVHNMAYATNVVDYSKFLRILYNGSYLKKSNSELCLEWLAQSSFVSGMTKYLPKDAVVCRKFGEFGLNAEKQWHESGIVYYNNKTYLLTIMTKGMDIVKMRETISEISRLVFTNM